MFLYVCLFIVLLYFVLFAFFLGFLYLAFYTVGLLTCKTVSQITYTVLVETLKPAQLTIERFRISNQSLSHEIVSYLGSNCEHNSGIAEDHDDKRQEVCDDEDRRDHGLLCSVTAVRAPRHTRSVDDVRPDETDGRQVYRHDDPNDSDCSVLHTPLHLHL